MPYTLYGALGDSMGTDHYPTCDVRGLDLPPARLDPLGAASLLHRNDDSRWPEFRGLDLETLSPDVEFLGLAEDGAMIDDVATEESYGRLPLEHLERFNDTVRRTAASLPRTMLADVHGHFLGHGVRAPEGECWYWSRNLIEPHARGASEMRRVWWRLLEEVA
jgi:hypothetical protein